MTDEPPDEPQPSVYDRLSAAADRRWQPRTPPRWATPLGIVLMIAIVVVLVIAVRTAS